MDNRFSTKDLYLGGMIYAKGAKFVGIERQGNVCWFVFENKAFCEDLQQQFYARTAEVNAKGFTEAIRTLKELVFSNQ